MMVDVDQTLTSDDQIAAAIRARRAEARPGAAPAPAPEPAPASEPAAGSPAVEPAPLTPIDPPVPSAAETTQVEGAAPPEEEERVSLPDGTQVSVEELASGYLRQSDYTQKTQDLSRQRNEIQQQREQVDTAVQQRVGHLDQLISGLTRQVQQPGVNAQELAELEATDPARWSAFMFKQQQQQKLLSDAEEHRAVIAKQQRDAYVPQAREELAQRVPAFAKDFNAEYAELGQYVVDPGGGGLSPEEWEQLMDPRYIALVWKAKKYDDATRAGAEVTRNLTHLPKPGRPAASRIDPEKRENARETAEQEVAVATERIKTGGGRNLDDIAAAIRATRARNKAAHRERLAGATRT